MSESEEEQKENRVLISVVTVATKRKINMILRNCVAALMQSFIEKIIKWYVMKMASVTLQQTEKDLSQSQQKSQTT